MDIVPGIKKTLLSGNKMAEAGYTSLYDEDEVNFYNKTAKIVISEEAVLTGYRYKRMKLWRVALEDQVSNENTYTVIVDSPCGLWTTISQFTLRNTNTNKHATSHRMAKYRTRIHQQCIRSTKH